MWFRFPEGVEQISVQAQNFVKEVEDSAGFHWFRAPDHFAPHILGLGMKFTSGVPDVKNLPEDLPKADPKRDDAITLMAGENKRLDLENNNLRATLAETLAERDGLKLALHEAEQRSAELEEQLEARGKDVGEGGVVTAAAVEVAKVVDAAVDQATPPAKPDAILDPKSKR